MISHCAVQSVQQSCVISSSSSSDHRISWSDQLGLFTLNSVTQNFAKYENIYRLFSEKINQIFKCLFVIRIEILAILQFEHLIKL